MTPPNKELKLTKPSIMELRSLTPVFGAPRRALVMAMGLEGRIKARREAPLHVQLKLTRVPAQCPDTVVSVEGRIVSMFRGQALSSPGAMVKFPIWVCSSEKEPTGPAFVYFDDLVRATYMELYLYGSPPECKLAAYEYALIAAPSATPVLSMAELLEYEGTMSRKWWQFWKRTPL